MSKLYTVIELRKGLVISAESFVEYNLAKEHFDNVGRFNGLDISMLHGDIRNVRGSDSDKDHVVMSVVTSL